jgi:hypothetical protein
MLSLPGRYYVAQNKIILAGVKEAIKNPDALLNSPILKFNPVVALARGIKDRDPSAVLGMGIRNLPQGILGEELLKKVLPSLKNIDPSAAALAMAFPGVAAKHVMGFQDGGLVGSTDTVPAMLTPGEYVIPKDIAQEMFKGYADGGIVSPSPSLGGGASTGGGGISLNFNGDINNKQDKNTILREVSHALDRLMTTPGSRFPD